MRSQAVIFEEPGKLDRRAVDLKGPAASDIVVDALWSGISTGTERLLWTGAMPPFPGLGYPLVPGYETVGRVRVAGEASGKAAGDLVFVPGCSAYQDVRGLFGGTASCLVSDGARAAVVPESLGADASLLALAATAHHALAGGDFPDLIVGHGVLGRLIARTVLALGGAAPTVWETNAARRDGAVGYCVLDPQDDDRRDYRTIMDVSGDAVLIDALIGRLAPGGELVLAGFYSERIGFDFAPAFMKEARLRVVAEWKPDDLSAVIALVRGGALSLGGLITHHSSVADAAQAYDTAFGDAACLKMILNWRDVA
ncbi:MAG: chlorophyll synthesis pathway protein BchC [Pseudomonadota bacterium]